MSRFLKYFNKKFEYFMHGKILNLTQNQKDLLFLLAKGLTIREISLKLNKKYENIKKQTSNLYKKFECNDRKSLINYALAKNIIKNEDIKTHFNERFKN